MPKSLIDIENCLNAWTPEQLAQHAAMVLDGRPVRYRAKPKRISFLASCWWWLIKGRWMRYENTFEPIYPDEPGYAEAPFEMGVIWHKPH